MITIKIPKPSSVPYEPTIGDVILAKRSPTYEEELYILARAGLLCLSDPQKSWNWLGDSPKSVLAHLGFVGVRPVDIEVTVKPRGGEEWSVNLPIA